jgi:iron complex outermembrane receptor protein
LELRPVVHLRRHHDDFILRRSDPDFYRNEHTSTQYGAEAALRYRASDGLTLATGGEILLEDLESNSLGDRSEGRWALFGEALGVWGPVTIGAGVRGDRYESYGFALSPSVSVALQADELRVRGLVGRSFRAPSWTERFYEDPANRGREDLDPERAWAAEVGADMRLFGSAELSVSAFGRKALGLIDWARPPGDEMAVWETRNVKTATFRGLEARLQGIVLVGADIAVQGSAVSVSVGEADDFVSKYALRPLVREVSVSLNRGLGPAVAESQLKYRRREAEGSYWLMDLRVVVPGRLGAVYVDVLNVLDAEYQLITGTSAPGRSVMVGFRVGTGGRFEG